ncbi:type IV pilus assembly protein PilM [Patescibacteria group bacterium]
MENPLKNILKTGTDFFKKEDSVIGIDIGSSFLKVVQLKKKHGKAVLETYGELALGPYAGLSVGQATNLDVPKIAEALDDLLRESNVTTKNSALSIPLSSSLLSIMEMPDLDTKQLAKMIPVEARKYIPVPITEVTLDWWIVPKTPQAIGVETTTEPVVIPKKEKIKTKRVGKVDVLVVAIHNDVVSKYQEIIKASGLQNSFLELEVFSTTRSTFGSHASPVMILDVGAGSTKIAVVEYGIIKNQHIINKGSQDITVAISKSLGVDMKRAEELKKEVGLKGSNEDEINKKVSEIAQLTTDHVFSEVSRVLLSYQRQHNKTIGQVILSGGGALLKGLHEFAVERLETEVVFADPFSKIDAPAFLEPVLKEAGPEFAVSLGLALRKLQEFE